MLRFRAASALRRACPLRRVLLIVATAATLPVHKAGAEDTTSPRSAPSVIAQATSPTAVPVQPASPESAGSLSLDLDVVAQRLVVARGQIQPGLGATVYEFRRDTIETQPQGDNQPLNQLVLQ